MEKDKKVEYECPVGGSTAQDAHHKAAFVRYTFAVVDAENELPHFTDVL